MDQLDFGADTSMDYNIEDLGYSKPELQNDPEYKRYDDIKDVQDKRIQFILDIQNGTVDDRNYPSIFKQFADSIKIAKQPDGKYLITDSDKIKELEAQGKLNVRQKAIKQLFLKFKQTGMFWDRELDAASKQELKRTISDAAQEILMHIPQDHPTRKLIQMDKSGQLNEIINYHLKQMHYDLFNPDWIKMYIRPEILKKMFELRTTENKEKRGILEDFKIRLKEIFK